jgi:DNA mismatch endonuclease (patch repair protein)
MDKQLREILGGQIFTETCAVRSRTMSKIRGKGNRTTEVTLQMALVRAAIRGWELHRRDLPGRPDFFFPKEGLAIFVDGCFWHFCAKCGHIPQTRSEYWTKKFELNMARDRRNVRKLRKAGIGVLRIWEHQLKTSRAVQCVVRRIAARLS